MKNFQPVLGDTSRGSARSFIKAQVRMLNLLSLVLGENVKL